MHEDDGAARFRVHLVLEMRVFHIDHVAGLEGPVAEAAFALGHIPELREIVPVQREARARLVGDEARIGRVRGAGRRARDAQQRLRSWVRTSGGPPFAAGDAR